MKKTVCLAASFCLLLALVDGIAAEGILQKTNPMKYRVRVGVEMMTVGKKPDILVAELPLPETNEYQTIRHFTTPPGNVLAYPENGEKYIACRFAGADCPLPGMSVTVFQDFEVTLYDIAVDFSKIEKIYPYNKNTPLYRRYTEASGVYVNPNNLEIQRIAAGLTKESKDPIEFARKAYSYVSEHYQYLNPLTGLHPLETLLRNGGGDCGNLSSIFISLLRSRGIPARHIFAVRPDGSYHSWAEFYLEKYGWIPVDVTYRQSDKTNDYFGRVRVNGNGIIVSRDVDVSTADHKGNPQKVAHMQTFSLWNWWKSSPIGKIESKYFLKSRQVN